ncbi:hypothetical protein EJB05_38025, partial [Eragrostis curvula]
MSARGQEAALDIEQEYNNTLRLLNEQRCEEEMEALLQDMTMHRRTYSPEIEVAMAGYFNASAKASEMCVELLRDIKSTQSGKEAEDREGRQEALEGWPRRGVRRGRGCRRRHCSAPAVRRPDGRAGDRGSVPNRAQEADDEEDDEVQQDRVFVRLREQLDTAAKGTYVLGNDLDTVSQLVARLSDGIERENAMAQYCVERERDGSSVPEMVSELKKSFSNSRRLALELEEHVCLCLATIDRARVLVIQEIFKKA